jgi:hypothetical protein
MTDTSEYARQIVEHEMPINNADLSFLFIHILRVPAIFSEAQRLLTADLFNGTEQHFSLLWRSLQELHAARCPINYMSLHYTLQTKIINDVHKELPASQADELLRPDQLGLLYTTNNTNPSLLSPTLARKILQKFLHERRVINPLRTVMQQGGGRSHVFNFRGLIESAMANIRSIDTINEAPIAIGMPVRGGDLPPPVVCEPTTLSFVDPWILGQRRGDTNGILGVYGSGKTTTGIQFAITNARTYSMSYRGLPGEKRRLSVFLSYEEPEWKMNARIWACASEIQRSRIDTVIGTRNWSMLTTQANIEPYERSLPCNRSHNGAAILSETERWDLSRTWLNSHFVLMDMSGSDKHQGAGRGYVPEIRAVLDRLVDERKAEIGSVVIDYAGLVCKRFMIANNIDEDKLRHRLAGIGDQLRTEVSEPLGATTWLLHQFNGEQAKRSPTKLLNHTDAAESKAFAENMACCGCLGTRDAGSRVLLLNWSKVRYHSNNELNMPRLRINGDFSRMDDVSDQFVLAEAGGGFVDPATRNALSGHVEEPRRRPRNIQSVDPMGGVN